MNHRYFPRFFPVFLIGATLLLTSGCAMETMSIAQTVSGAIARNAPSVVRPRTPETVVVCRDKQCAHARSHMSRESIFNSILKLLDNNTGTRFHICDADPYAHTCINDTLTYKIMAGVTPGKIQIGTADLLETRMKKGSGTINVAVDYDISFNGVRPPCKPAHNILFARSADYVVMEDSGFSCKLTTVSSSTVSHVYAIDFIDLDYGIIGAHYSVGVSGPAFGGGKGYVLMRFENGAVPPKPKRPKGRDSRAPRPETKPAEPGSKRNTGQFGSGHYEVRPLPSKR